MRPNVLLLVMDTARADAFEPYGAAPGSTPCVAQLAGSGAALENVRSTASWTLPSHASMFTGLLPRMARLEGPAGVKPQDARGAYLSHRDRALPEVLRRYGYATGAISTNLWISAESGFDQGFDEFVSIDSGRQAAVHREDLRGRLDWIREGVRAEVDDGAGRAEEVLKRWIADETGEKPFFWFVNLVECHSPYLPPKPYNDLGLLSRARAADEARKHLNLVEIWRACAGGFDIPDDALERMAQLYASSVRYMDDWLSRIVERLDSNGLLRDTWVIVTSDHGENLGEGQLITHALSLDDRLTRVPFVMSGPAKDHLPAFASLAELPSVISSLVGLEDDPWAADELPSVAVSQLDAPARADDPRTEWLIDQWSLGDHAFKRITTSFEAACDGDRKLIREPEKTFWFDLQADPLELNPISAEADDPDLAQLRAALDHPAAQRAEPEGTVPVQSISDDEREDLEDRMRLLGYL